VKKVLPLLVEAAMPCSVVGCCAMDKHKPGLYLSRKAILDTLRVQSDLIYGWSPCRKHPCPCGNNGSMGMVRHKRRWVSREYWRGHTVEKVVTLWVTHWH